MYNLNNPNIYKNKQYTKIISNNKTNYLYKVTNPNRVIEIHNVLNNKTEYNKIISNKNNEIITEYNNEYYVLLEENTNYEILSTNIKLNKNNYQINQSNWNNLWTIKTDYYESLNINNNLIKETINYYIGLSENAIEFLKYNEITTEELFICNTTFLDLNNPLNIVLDCKERQVGELIKHKFFYEEISIIEINKMLEGMDIKKVIARLLYPNYYFDIVDEYLNGIINEDKLKQVINKQTKYEQLISIISSYENILIPNWIKKDK